jgi:hypothetical protein
MAAMNGQFLCNRPISVSYAFKKDSKGERHGTLNGACARVSGWVCVCESVCMVLRVAHVSTREQESHLILSRAARGCRAAAHPQRPAKRGAD